MADDWSQAAAQARYMGLNVALFDFSDQDFVRFSVGNLFTPLVCLFTVGLCVLGLDKWLRGRIGAGDGPAVQRAAGAVAVVGVILAGAALLVVALQPDRTVLYASSALMPNRSTATTGCTCWQSAEAACFSCPTGGLCGAGPWWYCTTTTMYGLSMDAEDPAVP